MPISIWGRIKQAYRDSIGASGDGLGLYTVTVTLSNDRMKTLRASPFTLVKAIPNRTLIPLQRVITSPDVSTARTGNYDIRLEWHRGGSNYTSAGGDIDRTTVQGSTSGPRVSMDSDIDVAGALNLVGMPLVLRNVDGGEYGSGSSNNEVTFKVIYYVV